VLSEKVFSRMTGDVKVLNIELVCFAYIFVKVKVKVRKST